MVNCVRTLCHATSVPLFELAHIVRLTPGPRRADRNTTRTLDCLLRIAYLGKLHARQVSVCPSFCPQQCPSASSSISSRRPLARCAAKGSYKVHTLYMQSHLTRLTSRIRPWPRGHAHNPPPAQQARKKQHWIPQTAEISQFLLCTRELVEGAQGVPTWYRAERARYKSGIARVRFR